MGQLSRAGAARREPSAFLWGGVIVVLAVPMLLALAVEWAYLGPDEGIVRSSVVLVELAVVIGWALSSRGVFVPRRVNRAAVALGMLWVFASVAATLGAEHPVPAVLRSAEWVAHGLFAAVLWVLFQQDEKRVPAAQQALALGFVALAGLVAVAAARMPDPASYGWGTGVPYLGNIRYFGMYALAGAVFSSRSLLDPTASRQARYWATLGLSLGWAVLIWTGGRASTGSMLVAGAVMWWMAGTQRRSFAVTSVFATGAGTALSLCFPVERGAGGLWRILGYSALKGPGADLSNGRARLWERALEGWSEQPWLGLGPDAAAFVLAPFQHFQPHNLVVQALTDWGVLGTVPFLALGTWLLYQAYAVATSERETPRRASRIVAGAFVVGATVHAMADGYFYDARCLLLVAAATAMALVPGDRAACRYVPIAGRTRGAVGGIAVGLIVLFGLHLAAVRAVWGPGVPEPDAPRVALLKAFPSPSHLRETARWARAWVEEEPDEALALTRWAQQHARLPWYYLRLEGEVLLQHRRRAEAVGVYEEAERLETQARAAAR